MINKPELFENINDYGGSVIYEYENLAESLDKMQIEILNTIINCVYKEGLKDGFLLHTELDTN